MLRVVAVLCSLIGTADLIGLFATGDLLFLASACLAFAAAAWLEDGGWQAAARS